MGDAVDRLAEKTGLVELARVYIPPFIRVNQYGGVENVNGYWRDVSPRNPLTPEELRAVANPPDLPPPTAAEALEAEEERLYAVQHEPPPPVVSPDPSNQAAYPDRPELQEAYDRLNLGDRDLDELYSLRDDTPLDVSELEAVNNEIEFLESEEESGGNLPTSPGMGPGPSAEKIAALQAKVDAAERQVSARAAARNRKGGTPTPAQGLAPRFRTFVDAAVEVQKQREAQKTKPRIEVTDEGLVDVTGLPDTNPPDLPPVAPRLTPSGHRGLSEIASEIRRDWKQPNFAAKPYLDALGSLDDIKDQYGYDSASSVVAYFLSNASSWRGPKAKEIKAELKAILKKQ